MKGKTPTVTFFDKPPKYLLKGFSKQIHAQKFITNCEVRLGNLQTYNSIEDNSRKDQTEGESHVLTIEKIKSYHINRKTQQVINSSSSLGVMHHKGSISNIVYIFCSSSPEVNRKLFFKKFGPHHVEIFNPKAFVNAISLAAKSKKIFGLNLLNIITYKVSYNYGEVSNEFDMFNFKALIAQKPPNFSPECEFRIALIYELDVDLELVEEYLTLKLENCQRFARIV
jgi:hypothetical protein